MKDIKPDSLVLIHKMGQKTTTVEINNGEIREVNTTPSRSLVRTGVLDPDIKDLLRKAMSRALEVTALKPQSLEQLDAEARTTLLITQASRTAQISLPSPTFRGSERYPDLEAVIEIARTNTKPVLE